jgi:DNA-binding IclR family transcriptional regulator
MLGEEAEETRRPMLTKTADAGKGRARGLERAFEILEFLRHTRRPLNPNEIAAGLGGPRSSIYELVNLMLANGVLEKDAGGQVYLGRRLYFLGNAYADRFDLGHEAEKLLDRLANETRETSQLCMLDGNKYTVAQMVEGARPFRISSDVGEPVPIPWTASGRLLVMHMSDAEIVEFIPPDDFVQPNGTLLEPKAFLKQVAGARRDGYFTQRSATDTFTHCFAAPVMRETVCIATLCLVAPKDDAAKNNKAYVKALVEAAAALSHHSSIR